MIKVQLKDNCFLWLGHDSDCQSCNGLGEVYTWVSIEELSHMMAEIQLQKVERYKFPESEEGRFQNPFAADSDLEPMPNTNI